VRCVLDETRRQLYFRFGRIPEKAEDRRSQWGIEVFSRVFVVESCRKVLSHKAEVEGSSRIWRGRVPQSQSEERRLFSMASGSLLQTSYKHLKYRRKYEPQVVARK
jgi:hypothetical protein